MKSICCVSVVTLFTVLLAAGKIAAGDSSSISAKSSAGNKAPECSKVGITDTLVVTARLTEIPGTFVDNDLYDYVYVMKYRILSVERGVYEGRDILVGHYNPLISRRLVRDRMDPFVDGNVERFTVGARHRLVLIGPIERVWEREVEDEFMDSDLVRFFALRADALPQ